MAYPFDESFETGIPAGFGAAGGAGGVAATWNATDQAVDLAFTQAQNFWTITAGAQANDFWFEMDVEIVAAPFSPPHFGFWFWDGVGTYEGQRVAIGNAVWKCSLWSSTGSESEAEVAASAWWAIVGARKTIRIDAKKSAEGVWAILVAVDGEATAAWVRRFSATFLPGIFGYGITLRLRRAAGGTPSALPDTPLLQRRGLSPVVGRRILVPEHAAALAFNHRGLRRLALTRNHYYHGTHRIAGSVKVKGAPDVPVSRRVLLYDERANVVVRETWSDGATGAYSFDLLNPEIRYLVIAYDHKQNYRAVVADNLSAEPGS